MLYPQDRLELGLKGNEFDQYFANIGVIRIQEVLVDEWTCAQILHQALHVRTRDIKIIQKRLRRVSTLRVRR